MPDVGSGISMLTASSIYRQSLHMLSVHCINMPQRHTLQQCALYLMRNASVGGGFVTAIGS